MNLPLKRKLEHAILAWLDAGKEDTAFESLPLYCADGTTRAQELLHSAAPETVAKPQPGEPEPPFLAVVAATQADPALAHTHSFEIVLHLQTDATLPDASRLDTDAILRDLYQRVMESPDDTEIIGDGNQECGAFVSFANKPEAAEDTRDALRTPLHIYRMWPTSAPELFEGGQWSSQLIFAGHCQDMDSHEDEEEEDP